MIIPTTLAKGNNKMTNLKETIMTRDSLTSSEADELIEEAKEEFNYLLSIGETEVAYDICSAHFGLEPNYITDLT